MGINLSINILFHETLTSHFCCHSSYCLLLLPPSDVRWLTLRREIVFECKCVSRLNVFVCVRVCVRVCVCPCVFECACTWACVFERECVLWDWMPETGKKIDRLQPFQSWTKGRDKEDCYEFSINQKLEFIIWQLVSPIPRKKWMR